MIWFGENLNPNVSNFTVTAPFVGRGTDESRFNFLLVLHATVVDGVAKADVVNFRCEQG